MTLNDVLTKQNVITKIELATDSKELPKELKVKIMRMRMAYNKVRKQFDEDLKEFSEQIVPEELKELSNKKDRTTEEDERFVELNNKANAEYNEFVIQKSNEEVKDEINDKLTEEEYFEIMEVNAANDVEINGNKIKAADFLEIIYDLFV